MLVIPFTFATAGLNTPTPNLDSDFSAIAAYINARNPTVGAIGSRPAAGNAGAIYVASDQNYLAYVDDGSAWQPFGIVAASYPGASFWDFAQISTPATPASTHERLYAAVSGGITALNQLLSTGQASAIPGVLFRLATTQTVINTTTETTLFSLTIKANTLGTGRLLRVTVLGDYTNNTAGTRTMTVRSKLGASANLPSFVTSALAQSSSVRLWMLQVWLNSNAGGNQRAQCRWTMSVPGGGAPTDDLQFANTGSENLATDLTYAVSLQHSNNDCTANMYYGQVEYL